MDPPPGTSPRPGERDTVLDSRQKLQVPMPTGASSLWALRMNRILRSAFRDLGASWHSRRTPPGVRFLPVCIALTLMQTAGPGIIDYWLCILAPQLAGLVACYLYCVDATAVLRDCLSSCILAPQFSACCLYCIDAVALLWDY